MLVKNVGLVVVEVKRPLAKLKNGMQQCDRMADFSALVFEESGSSTSLPVAKVVVIGEAPQGSTGPGTVPFIEKNENRGVWVLYKEATETSHNFQDCWQQILHDLKKSKGTDQATPTQYEYFSQRMTGLWSMVVFNRPLECIGK